MISRVYVLDLAAYFFKWGSAYTHSGLPRQIYPYGSWKIEMEVVPLGKYMSEWVFNVFQLVDQVFFCAWSNNRYLLAAVRNCHGKNNSKSNISPTFLKQIGGIFDASSVVMLSVCIFHLEVESKVAYFFFQSCLSIIYIFQYLYTLCVSTQIIFTYVTY